MVYATIYLKFSKGLMDGPHSSLQHVLQLLNDKALPYVYLVNNWVDKSRLQRRLLSPYYPDSSLGYFNYLHVFYRGISGSTHSTVDPFKHAVDNEIKYGNANHQCTAVERLPKYQLQCVNNEGRSPEYTERSLFNLIWFNGSLSFSIR